MFCGTLPSEQPWAQGGERGHVIGTHCPHCPQDSTRALGWRHHLPWRLHTPSQALVFRDFGQDVLPVATGAMSSPSWPAPRALTPSAALHWPRTTHHHPAHSPTQPQRECNSLPYSCCLLLCPVTLGSAQNPTEILQKVRWSHFPCSSEQFVFNGHLKHKPV